MVGLAENEATQPSLAGAWAELGKNNVSFYVCNVAFSLLYKLNFYFNIGWKLKFSASNITATPTKTKTYPSKQKSMV